MGDYNTQPPTGPNSFRSRIGLIDLLAFLPNSERTQVAERMARMDTSLIPEIGLESTVTPGEDGLLHMNRSFRDGGLIARGYDHFMDRGETNGPQETAHLGWLFVEMAHYFRNAQVPSGLDGTSQGGKSAGANYIFNYHGNRLIIKVAPSSSPGEPIPHPLSYQGVEADMCLAEAHNFFSGARGHDTNGHEIVRKHPHLLLFKSVLWYYEPSEPSPPTPSTSRPSGMVWSYDPLAHPPSRRIRLALNRLRGEMPDPQAHIEIYDPGDENVPLNALPPVDLHSKQPILFRP